MPRKQTFASSLFSVLSAPSALRSLLLRATAFSASLALTAAASSSQQPMHHHADVPLVKPEYPQMGRAQATATGPLFTLEQAEKMAQETNPTLRQAEAEIRSAKARAQQVALYPNP